MSAVNPTHVAFQQYQAFLSEMKEMEVHVFEGGEIPFKNEDELNRALALINPDTGVGTSVPNELLVIALVHQCLQYQKGGLLPLMGVERHADGWTLWCKDEIKTPHKLCKYRVKTVEASKARDPLTRRPHPAWWSLVYVAF